MDRGAANDYWAKPTLCVCVVRASNTIIQPILIHVRAASTVDVFLLLLVFISLKDYALRYEWKCQPDRETNK